MLGSSSAVIGVDAHILTGKHQGSRTWLAQMLHALGRLDTENRYVVYSHDPAVTARDFPFANFQHRSLGARSPIARLLLFWPYVQMRDRLDFLITQYIAPPLFAHRQIVVVHDLLFESHPRFFPWFMRWRNRLLVRRSARRARLVLTVSDFSRSELQARYGLPADRVVVTRNGANAVVAPAAPDQQAAVGRRYILSVGRIEPRKNLETLLAAHARLRATGLELVVVGRADFGCAPLLKAMARAPGVTHLGEVSDATLDRLYRGAQALVFPSFAEGFGLPLVEALSRGTPVISSNATAMPEVCGPHARYFDPTAPDAVSRLAALIAEVPEAPPPDRVREHLARYSWEGSALLFLDALRRIRASETGTFSTDAQMDVCG